MADGLVMRSVWSSLKGPRMPPGSSPTCASWALPGSPIVARGDDMKLTTFSIASYLRRRSALLLATG